MTSLLRFKVGNHTFALPIERVLQIIDERPITRVPDVSRSIAGVFNHDGVIMPVVDLATKFEASTTEAQRKCVVIVAADRDGEAVSIGLLTGGVVDVVNVPESSIDPAPSFGTRLRLEYLAGIANVGDGFTLLLDASRFLTAAELLDLQSVRESGAPKELAFA